MVKHATFSLQNIVKMISRYTASGYALNTIKTPEGVDGRVVSFAESASYVAEQYKSLRTNFYSICGTKKMKSAVITSSQPGEGKTITTANLAFTISMDMEKKVVAIDADLRKPNLHKVFGLDQGPGLSDILTHKVSIDSITEKPAFGNLYMIPAGHTVEDPSGVLVSTKITNLISELKKKFDYIIFDTPPAFHVTDASILGNLCDGVFLVVRAEHTQKNIIEETCNILKEAQAKPVATILTFHNRSMHYGKSYYSYPYTKK
jgi:protein-tyrosine kinase